MTYSPGLYSLKMYGPAADEVSLTDWLIGNRVFDVLPDVLGDYRDVCTDPV